jgi:hypothetical protein
MTAPIKMRAYDSNHTTPGFIRHFINKIAFNLIMDRVASTFERIWSKVNDVRITYHFNALTIVLGLFCLYSLYILIFGLFLCRTRHIPGPFLARFGKAYYLILFFGGSLSMRVHELHKKYGMSFLRHVN